MQLINTTKSFREAAGQIVLNLQDFAPVPDRTRIWWLQTERLPEQRLPEEIISLVRSYNTDEDKYRKIARDLKAKGFDIQYDAGPNILWLEGSIFPRDGQMAIAIVLPRLQIIQDKANAMRSSDLADGVRQTADNQDNQQQANLSLAVGGTPTDVTRISTRSLEQKPHIVIRSLADDNQSPASMLLLQAGDILVLNANECIEVKSGGVALILIRYKVKGVEMGQE